MSVTVQRLRRALEDVRDETGRTVTTSRRMDGAMLDYLSRSPELLTRLAEKLSCRG